MSGMQTLKENHGNDVKGDLAPVIDRVAHLLAAHIADYVRRILDDSQGCPGSVVTPGLLDVDGAAAHLSLSKSTVYKLSASGRIPKVQLGGRLLFRMEDLESYIRRNRRSA